MKGKLTLQQRLILPIVLLGLVTLLSNLLAVFSINNVNANAGVIVDEYMASETRLEEIRRSMMDIHRLALSHIVAADHGTMIRLVREIKEEEASLDGLLEEYTASALPEELETCRALSEDYEEFKHALVSLVCASADSKTQEAYAMANGDVAHWSGQVEGDVDTLRAAVGVRAQEARDHLFFVYVSALVISAVTLTLGVVLVIAAFRIIRRHVISPIRDAMATLQVSSERIGGVVEEVRDRTQRSGDSIQELSRLTAQLSAALEEIAGSTAAIRTTASGTQGDAADMAEECRSITAYAGEIRGRAEELERSTQERTEAVRLKTEEVTALLDEAIEKSKSVDQIHALTQDILAIASSTNLLAINASVEATRAGEAGRGFAMVAREIRRLADSSSSAANHIQEVSAVVTGAVEHLTRSAQELVEYLSGAVLSQSRQSVDSGRQYRDDAAYIERCIEAFSSRVERLRGAMDEIAGAIANISGAIDGAATGVSGAAGSTQELVDGMAGITRRMQTNQEIVGELQRQVDVFANL